MENFLEVLQKSDFTNFTEVLLIAILLIIQLAKCIQLFMAKGVELVLMKNKEKNLRNSFVYIVLFFTLSGTNLFVTWFMSFLHMFVLLILDVLMLGVISILKRKGKISETKALNVEMFSVILLFSLASRYITSYKSEMIYAVCLFLAIIEVFILAVDFEQKISVSDKAFFIVEESGKWYLYNRMKNDLFLCGNHADFYQADQFRLFSSEEIGLKYTVYSEVMEEATKEDTKEQMEEKSIKIEIPKETKVVIETLQS